MPIHSSLSTTKHKYYRTAQTKYYVSIALWFHWIVTTYNQPINNTKTLCAGRIPNNVQRQPFSYANNLNLNFRAEFGACTNQGVHLLVFRMLDTTNMPVQYIFIMKTKCCSPKLVYWSTARKATCVNIIMIRIHLCSVFEGKNKSFRSFFYIVVPFGKLRKQKILNKFIVENVLFCTGKKRERSHVKYFDIVPLKIRTATAHNGRKWSTQLSM